MDNPDISLREVFNNLGAQNKGYITVEEFAAALTEIAPHPSQKNGEINDQTLTCQTLEALKKIINPDDGKINFEDFTKCFHTVMEGNNSKGFPNLQSTSISYDEFDMNSYMTSATDLPCSEELFESHADDGDETDDDFSECTSSGIWSMDSPTSGLPPPKASRQTSLLHSQKSSHRRRSTGGSYEPITRSQSSHHRQGSWRRGRRASFLLLSEDPEEEISSHSGPRRGREDDLDDALLDNPGSATSTVLAWHLDDEMGRMLRRQEDLEAEVRRANESLRHAQDKAAGERERAQDLLNRIHLMEDQIRDIESRHQDFLKSKEQQHKKEMTMLEMEKDNEIHHYKIKISQLEAGKTTSHDEMELNRMRNDYDKLAEEKRICEQGQQDALHRYDHLQQTLESYRQLTITEINQLQRERDRATELMTRLHSQLDQMNYQNRHQKSSSIRCVPSPLLRSPGHTSGLRSGSNTPSFTRARTNSGSSSNNSLVAELEDLVKKLTAENKQLQESISELQVEMMNRKIDSMASSPSPSWASRTLSSDTSPCESPLKMRADVFRRKTLPSLADELGKLDLEEMSTTLSIERETAIHLRGYINGLILRIMDSNAISLLQIPTPPQKVATPKASTRLLPQRPKTLPLLQCIVEQRPDLSAHRGF